MKTIIILLALSVPVVACDSGCEEHSGVCACYGTPEIAPSVKPSDEKPPRSQIPAWQSGAVKADLPPSTAAQDFKADQ
jgi:hypothetical protein